MRPVERAHVAAADAAPHLPGARVRVRTQTIQLKSQRDFDLFSSESWCSHPWVLYVTPDEPASKTALSLHEPARALFDRYDVDGSGTIEVGELQRMLKELDLQHLDVSPVRAPPAGAARPPTPTIGQAQTPARTASASSVRRSVAAAAACGRRVRPPFVAPWR